MDVYTKAFSETLLWSSTDDKGEPLDRNYDIYDIMDVAAIDSIIEQFKTLVSADPILQSFENITEYTGNDVDRIMHDLCLTINRCGAGFWDGDYTVNGSELFGDRLTGICREFNEISLYIGDDSKLYTFNG